MIPLEKNEYAGKDAFAQYDSDVLYMTLEKFNSLSAEEKFSFLLKHKSESPYLQIKVVSEQMWNEEFNNPYIETPIGIVKIASDQYKKDKGKTREQRITFYKMIKPTLLQPSVIYIDERQGTCFMKVFVDEKTNTQWFFAVGYNKDDKLKGNVNVIISSRMSNGSQVLRKLKKMEAIYLFNQNMAESKTGTDSLSSLTPNNKVTSNNSQVKHSQLHTTDDMREV